jgi:hypothetical protein
LFDAPNTKGGEGEPVTFTFPKKLVGFSNDSGMRIIWKEAWSWKKYW